MTVSEDPERLERRLDESIRTARGVAATLRLSSGGKSLAGREATISQTAHAFRIGSTWGNDMAALLSGELSGEARERAERRNGYFLSLFDQVTLPFYWARFEPERGKPQTEAIARIARWYKDRGMLVKGHPLCWHTLTAPWLLEMGEDEILAAQKARIRRDVADFAGLVDAWDVINEAVIMPVFDKYDNGITRLCKKMGRIPLIRAVFEEARATDPKATLLLNDFDMSDAYDILVEGCLEAGIKIDALGLQSHMHQGWWGNAKTERILDRFERFGLPIHFTENTIVSGRLMPPEIVDLNDYQVKRWPSTRRGEARQEREAILHYKTLLSRASVQSITWWDLSDGGWLGAPAGLLRADQSPKPAFEALRRLVKEELWVAPRRLRADAEGSIRFEGLSGDYLLEIDGTKLPFSLPKPGAAELELRL